MISQETQLHCEATIEILSAGTRIKRFSLDHKHSGQHLLRGARATSLVRALAQYQCRQPRYGAKLWQPTAEPPKRRANFIYREFAVLFGSGGEGGIRTHGTVARTPVFETGPIDHSGTSPGARTR